MSIVKAVFSSAITAGFCALLQSGCGPSDKAAHSPASSKALAPDILARVGDQPITKSDFEAEMARHERGLSGNFKTPEARRRLLDEMIRFQSLLARARAAGYDRDPGIQVRVNQLIVGQFQEDLLAQRGVELPRVDDATVRGFYEQHLSQFATPESVRAAIIFFRIAKKAEGSKRNELRQKAESILAQAARADPAGFGQLARSHSDDQTTRYAGGDTGWLTRGNSASRWDPAILEAALALKDSGECAPLVSTDHGFYVVRLLERKAAANRPYEEVRAGIEYQLVQKERQARQQQFFDEMKAGLSIEINEPLLQSMTAPEQVAESKPPILPKF